MQLFVVQNLCVQSGRMRVLSFCSVWRSRYIVEFSARCHDTHIWQIVHLPNFCCETFCFDDHARILDSNLFCYTSSANALRKLVELVPTAGTWCHRNGDEGRTIKTGGKTDWMRNIVLQHFTPKVLNVQPIQATVCRGHLLSVRTQLPFVQWPSNIIHSGQTSWRGFNAKWVSLQTNMLNEFQHERIENRTIGTWQCILKRGIFLGCKTPWDAFLVVVVGVFLYLRMMLPKYEKPPLENNWMNNWCFGAFPGQCALTVNSNCKFVSLGKL